MESDYEDMDSPSYETDDLSEGDMAITASLLVLAAKISGATMNTVVEDYQRAMKLIWGSRGQ